MKKSLKKLLGLIAISSFALFASTGIAVGKEVLAVSKKATPTKQDPIKYMFVVSAGSGEIKSGPEKGEYVLEMKIPTIDQVLQFSDRPNRIVKYIPASTLKQMWPVGNDSFRSDPPNAVLSSVNVKPMIIELKSVETSGSKLSFRFKVADGMQTQVAALKKVVLSIDGYFVELNSGTCPSSLYICTQNSCQGGGCLCNGTGMQFGDCCSSGHITCAF